MTRMNLSLLLQMVLFKPKELTREGIWTIFDSDQSVINFIRARLHKGMSLARICEELLDTIYMLTQGTSRCDNKTIMIVAFLNGKRSEQEWVEQCYMPPNGRLGQLSEGCSWEATQGVIGMDGVIKVDIAQKKVGMMSKNKTRTYSAEGLKGSRGGVKSNGGEVTNLNMPSPTEWMPQIGGPAVAISEVSRG
jgi:hypothetical protein